MEIAFYKEFLHQTFKLSNEYLSDISITQGNDRDDFISNVTTFKMSGCIYTNINEIKTIEVTTKKPSFLDWLLGRQIKTKVKIIAKDILKNPPTSIDSQRIYIIEKD